MVLNTRSRYSLVFITLILTVSFLSLVSLTPRASALSLYDSGDPTPAEQLVLEYINRARANPIAEGQRLGIDTHEGLEDNPPDCYGPEYVGVRPPLAMNPALLAVAQAHSADMYNQNYFSHTDPNGTTAFQRIENAGYDYVSAGENLGAGTGMTATGLEDLLMVDSGYPCRAHRMNLLDIFPYPPPAYYEVGIGYYEGPSGQAFITQDFGTAANTVPFLTGVVYNDANGNNFYDIGEGIPGVTITPSSGNYYAVSSSAGGYAIPIGTSGTITVTASGGRFGPITKTITLTGTNIELDFTPQGSSLMTTTPQSNTQTTSQSTTQTQTTSQTITQTQTASASTTQTSFQSTQLITQTSSSTTAPTLLESVTFQSTPSNFADATSPGTITACGNTYANSQSATCAMSFGATANLPIPPTGWQFNHWTWAGGVACSSNTANPVECSAYNSGGVLIAVYAVQVNVMTNPASSASVNLGACSEPGEGNGASFYTTTFGSTTITACNIPSGYSFLSWTCTGGLTCSTTANPTTLTITGPGSIALNLQTQRPNVTSTSMSSTSLATSSTVPVTATPQSTTSTSQATQTSTVSSQLTMAPILGFPWESIITGLVLGLAVLALARRRRK